MVLRRPGLFVMVRIPNMLLPADHCLHPAYNDTPLIHYDKSLFLPSYRLYAMQASKKKPKELLYAWS